MGIMKRIFRILPTLPFPAGLYTGTGKLAMGVNSVKRAIRIIKQGDRKGTRGKHTVHVAACDGDGNGKP